MSEASAGDTPTRTVSQRLAAAIASLTAAGVPQPVRERAGDVLLDVAGLCVAARNTDYVSALKASFAGSSGNCTALGHAGGFDMQAAAMLNGTAAHGEDFDDTFEGGIVHSGAAVVPAVLAACEQFRLDGGRALLGMCAGLETMCRLSLVAPKLIHKAGFHPTAVLGAMAATAAAGSALALDERQLTDAFGLAGSLAGGIIEYLSDGSWTKRMHPGWAAQAGIRAALMGRHGFAGPRRVLEGHHGFFNAFAHDAGRDFSVLLDGFGERWLLTDISFKPYPCGTMAQPYIDCALRLAARGVQPDAIAQIDCDTAEGYVHRLWDPLELKQAPPNAYAAKFSLPFIVAVALLKREVGLGAFTDAAAADPQARALAAKVRYRIDPDDPYPRVLTGHVRVTLRDGSVIEERQPYLRGGVNAPLTRTEIADKFLGNVCFGGWSDAQAQALRGALAALFTGPVDLAALRR